MPVITKITPQKRQGFYNIFVDGKYALALSETDMATFEIRTDQIVDKTLLETLREAHSNSKCYNCSLRYLAIRPRSICEVREYLVRRKGYSEDQSDRAIDRLVSQKYLDDEEFARLWIKNRIDLAPRPLAVIKMELLKKGVDRVKIDDCLAEIDESQQLDSICQLTSSRYRQSRYRDKQKLTEFLARRGYSYSLIQQAFEQLALFEN